MLVKDLKVQINAFGVYWLCAELCSMKVLRFLDKTLIDEISLYFCNKQKVV